MKARTQLVLAAIVLAVLPLAVIVVYSHQSSKTALESAYQREARRATKQMDRRLKAIRTELDQKLAQAANVKAGTPVAAETPKAETARHTGSTSQGDPVVQSIVGAMSDVSPLVDSVEFQPMIVHLKPMAPPPPATRRHAPPAAPPTRVDAPSQEAEAAPELPAPPAEPVVIEIPTVPDEVRAFALESATLALNAGNMTDEQRKAMEQQIEEKGKKLEATMALREKERERRRKEQIQKSEEDRRQARIVRRLTEDEARRIRMRQEQTSLILGKKYNAEVRHDGNVVGEITAQVRADEVIRRLLGDPDEEDISFALDRQGTLYTRTSHDRQTIEKLGIVQRLRSGRSLRRIEDWIVVTDKDPQSGLQFGVARPIGENFAELRRTAGRNFAAGLGLIALALIGIVPFANHLTRDEMQRRMMALEYERKSVELEDARRFQLSMLPKHLPQSSAFDVAVFTQTATEVGGDYYDFHQDGDVLSVTIGDATGHGAKAGTMVTVIKTLFTGYSAATPPATFLRDAAEKIKRMELGRMAMALAVARFEGRKLTVATAGMPPALIHRAATGNVDELTIPAVPLGTIDTDYAQLDVELASGDTVLFLSDGFPELQNGAGQQLGYTAVQQELARAASQSTDAATTIDTLASAARAWHGDTPPNDDITFVVVKVRG